MAKEYGQHNIRVNAINAGFVLTKGVQDMGAATRAYLPNVNAHFGPSCRHGRDGETKHTPEEAKLAHLKTLRTQYYSWSAMRLRMSQAPSFVLMVAWNPNDK